MLLGDKHLTTDFGISTPKSHLDAFKLKDQDWHDLNRLVGSYSATDYLPVDSNYTCGSHLMDVTQFVTTSTPVTGCNQASAQQMLANLIDYGNRVAHSKTKSNLFFAESSAERAKLHQLRLDPTQDFPKATHLLLSMLAVNLSPYHVPRMADTTTWSREYT